VWEATSNHENKGGFREWRRFEKNLLSSAERRSTSYAGGRGSLCFFFMGPVEILAGCSLITCWPKTLTSMFLPIRALAVLADPLGLTPCRTWPTFTSTSLNGST